MDERELRKIWRSSDGQNVPNYTITRGQDELLVKAGQCYLFRHLAMTGDPQSWTLDQYWKGLVSEVRVVPSTRVNDPDVLVAVTWFYSKEDIIQSCELQGRSKEDSRFEFLAYMAEQELCSSSDNVINHADSIECEVDIVLLRDIEQKPVSEYFVRACWDNSEGNLRGDKHLYGCRKQGCSKMWNPDKEEQRFCHFCDGWYHISCLQLEEGMSQKDMSERMAARIRRVEGSKDAPQSLHDFAHQPTARGGNRHFIAGNSRIVNKCATLLVDETRLQFINEHNVVNGDWLSALEEYFGLEPEQRGDINWEQILVEDQLVYRCATCGEGDDFQVV